MNRKYEVIALSVGGANNKIFKNGDKVTDANFGKDRADELVKGGFLKPLDTKKTAAEKIEEIESALSIDEVNEIVDGDTRKTVKEAAESRIEELEEE